ncbi:hypothetical protein NBRC116589_27590 [Ruegeria sp. HU-ET01832]|uniref:glycosyltransferase n=1 Tax=Ruegeria sp. HU-ET01832 TaxID=3135906 RepID=UPI003107FB7D
MTDLNEFPIWMYWENLPGRRMPTYLKMCFEIARQRLSGRLQLLDPQKIQSLLGDIEIDFSKIHMSDPNRNPLALKVDYYRAALLKKYGGLWLDVDCVVRKDIIPELKEALSSFDFWGMQKTETSGIVTNNIMASRPSGTLISEYLIAMDDLLKYKIEKNETFNWTEIGAELLTPIVEKNKSICKLEFESKVHPVNYTEHEKFWTRRDDLLDLDDRVKSANIVMLYNAMFTDAQKSFTRRQILNQNSLMGALMREGLSFQNEVPASSKKNFAEKASYSKKDVAIIFSTIERPESCLEFVKSIRKVLGSDIGIYIAAQGKNEEQYSEIEKTYGGRVFLLEEDAGLSKCRNYLVENTKEEILFLCDDDFVFDDRLKLDAALKVMSEKPEVSILGGMFENYDYREGKVSSICPTCFNHSMVEKESDVTFIPTEYVDFPREFIGNCAYIQKIDTVNNFALMRREVFSDCGVRWHDSIKIMGEHEHFYYQVKRCTQEIGVYYTNLLFTQHHRKTSSQFAALRRRNEGLAIAMNDIGVSCFRFPGKRTDVLLKEETSFRLDHRTWELSW